MNQHKSSPNAIAHPKYRPDIDGLRAIAVISVVAFHAFPNTLKGGFVGVDIFFIISGFLISSIILGSLNQGNFSFIEFYRRRILRIFPALIPVLLFCYAVGWFALLPKEFQQLGKHMVGGALFTANLFFWQEAGYFNNASETKPLLHLWSLGVEEQYYIVWPCLLLLAWKLRWNALKMIILIFVMSFAVNLYTVFNDEKVQAFYSPVSRFWELLLGGALAYWQLHAKGISKDDQSTKIMARKAVIFQSTALQTALSVSGILLIATALLIINKKSQFPGWWALLPTLGTCAIIAAGPQAIINRKMLSCRPLVWLGLISYPFYLWHWPLLSFARIIENKIPSPELRAQAVALALLLAWLTYLLIEKPVRFGARKDIKVWSLLAAMIFIVPLGGVAYYQGNVRGTNMSPERSALLEKFNFGLHFAGWTSCPNVENSWSCKFLIPNKPVEIAFIGDSHSVHLASGLAELDTIKRHNIRNQNSNGCMPVLEVELDGEAYYKCKNNISQNIIEAIDSKEIKIVMLSGHAIWKIRPSNERLELVDVTDQEAQKNAGILEKALFNTLTRLVASGKKIVFFVDNPELDFEPSECVPIRPFYFKWHRLKAPCAVSRQRFDQRNVEYHEVIRHAEKAFPTVKFIKLYDYLCDASLCYAVKDGVLLYMDHDHLSADGSRYLAKKFAHELNF